MWESSVWQMFSTQGLPPSIVLNEPVIGSLYNEGESIPIRGTKCQIQRMEFGDLSIDWESSVDGVFSTQGVTIGLVQFTTSTLTFGCMILSSQ